MKKPGIIVTVLAVVVVSYFVMAYAVAQTCGASKPAAAAAAPTCGGCPSSAAASAPASSGCPSATAAAPAGCPMAAKKSGKSPEIVKALPDGQVRLSWQPGPSRGDKVLKLAVERPANQLDAGSTVTAYYMSSAGNHSLKLTPAGAGVYTAPVKVAPGAELAVRVTSQSASNVVYFGLPQWAGARANCVCPGGQPGADCKCPGMNCKCPGCDCKTTGKCTCADCKCETTGKCTCPANKAIGSDCNCPGCDCKTTGKCTCADCKCETTGKCTCPGNKTASGSSCGAKPAVASCGAKAQSAAAKACGGCR